MKTTIIMMLMLFIGTAAVTTSCKKEEKKSIRDLLTSGKWYYNSFKNGDYTSACFEATDYWEFKTDGIFTETWDLGGGSYTLSDDGKTLNLTAPNWVMN